jgi:hypothetical protein
MIAAFSRPNAHGSNLMPRIKYRFSPVAVLAPGELNRLVERVLELTLSCMFTRTGTPPTASQDCVDSNSAELIMGSNGRSPELFSSCVMDGGKVELTGLS